MTQVQVVSGDVSRVNADVLITAINSGGMWFGGIDRVIQRVAGELFHEQASQAMPLSDGQVVLASNNGRDHGGAFNSVIFVVDDLKQPLRKIVYNGLKKAHDAGFKTVSLPTIRMGVMLGVVEKSLDEAVSEMVSGVSAFRSENPETSVESISFIVYNDDNTKSVLQSALMAN